MPPSSPKNRQLEILALVAVAIGLLLLVDVGLTLAAFFDLIKQFSPTAWLGLALITGGLLLLAYRMRVRFLRSAVWAATDCPRCGGHLHMAHRHWYERVLSKTLLPHARRYRCGNKDCRWTGLRRVRHRGV
jgi:hypothetical protein